MSKDSRGLIGGGELAAMKPTAYLVDVSRGGIVDQPVLILALREQKIAGAALDVFPEEPLPPDNPLWKFPNVIITPHIAGISSHYDQRAVDLFVENLQHYLDGQPLLNRIDLERGY
jgi:phosphoglycerate dehydrogenase-like enzyme